MNAGVRPNNCKILLPQIIASLIAASCSLSVGTTLVFSAVLIPQLKDPSNTTILVTKSDISWIASIFALFAPLGSVVAGFAMEKYGRINGLKLAIIPSVFGQISLALAPNLFWIMLARSVLGFASLMIWNPSTVYITEITRKDVRGPLVSLGTTFIALGMVITYLQGYLLHWRTICWTNLIILVASFAILFFIPESPSWLISKNRHTEARKALSWLYRYHQETKNGGTSFVELQYQQIVNEKLQKMEMDQKTNTIREFLKPTGYKPLLILMGLFFFQQFSGIYIVFLYSVNFIKASGTLVNPYLTSVSLGLMRVIFSLCNAVVLKKFGRRPLLILTSFGMSACMLGSGLVTYRLKNGESSYHYFPIFLLLLYVVFAIFGILTLPWTMNAEMFPLKIRGVAQGLATGILHVFMFGAIQNYQNMEDLLGSAGLQWLFSGVSLVAVGYIYVFVPETHNKSLLEIENYFLTNTVYLRRKIGNNCTKTPALPAENNQLLQNV